MRRRAARLHAEDEEGDGADDDEEDEQHPDPRLRPAPGPLLLGRRRQVRLCDGYMRHAYINIYYILYIIYIYASTRLRAGPLVLGRESGPALRFGGVVGARVCRCARARVYARVRLWCVFLCEVSAHVRVCVRARERAVRSIRPQCVCTRFCWGKRVRMVGTLLL